MPKDPEATAIRREIARFFRSTEKLVTSDKLSPTELSPWDNTRVIPCTSAYTEIADLKQQGGKNILVLLSRLL